jgi:type II secretory ATPase GspE/PulE/Tfp pilus assembly ATPase PilB-like protein
VPKPANVPFPSLVSALPDFDSATEFNALVRTHGISLALLDAVIDEKVLSKEEACRCWADSQGVAYVDPFASIITEDAVLAIPVEVAKKAMVIGLYIVDGVLTVAMATPRDAELIKRLGQIAQMPISAVFALPREIIDAIHIQYSSEKNLEDSLNELERSSLFDQGEIAMDRLAALADSDSVVRILDEIIHFAIRERATDIHIEAHETQSRIRFRVDGRLRQVLTFSRKLHRALLSRLKIMANLNIAESRFPQDGRFSIQLGAAKANFRLSSIPGQYGEKAVIRVLAMTGRKSIVTLDKMMMSQTILHPFRRLIANPNGIIFVTGPTGSGKTTTLYAALHEINTPDVNISTIEDPIEIQLEGVNQSQVNAHIDLNFATLLRSLLRQDPDVILVGEIRDLETAKIATEAALTGHIVFATLHTNSAPQALVRMHEIGVERYMIAPTVMGVLAQRLAARICENCKEPYYPSPDVLRKYFADEGLTEVPFYRGRGCSACRGTGYKGRIAFHELLVVTEEVRAMISENRSIRDIVLAAKKVGYQPLRYDGLKKVLLGLTTIEEIEHNTSIEFAS